MANEENKDFADDIADQGFQQNGEGGGGDATENGGSAESQEDR